MITTQHPVMTVEQFAAFALLPENRDRVAAPAFHRQGHLPAEATTKG